MTFRAVFLVLAFFLSDSASAKPYFSHDKISPSLIDPPIDRKTQEYQNEVLQIIELQKKPDPLEVRKSEEERIVGVELLVVNFERKSYPKLYHLLDRTLETTILITESHKNYWNTKRPFLSEEKIKALVEPANNPSYPSGHTSSSYVLARVLSQLFPQKSKDFMNRAEVIAGHRILVGMHFPHDIEGGRQLSLVIIGALFRDDSFLLDYQSAKSEIESKLD
jgi:acid phosphatase (class A)